MTIKLYLKLTFMFQMSIKLNQIEL